MTNIRRNDNFNLPVVEGQDLDLQIQLQALRVDSQGTVQRDPVTNAVIYDPLDTTGWDARLQVVDRFRGSLMAALTTDLSGSDGYVSFTNSGLLTIKMYEAVIDKLKGGMPYDFFAGLSNSMKKWLHGTLDYERKTL